MIWRVWSNINEKEMSTYVSNLYPTHRQIYSEYLKAIFDWRPAFHCWCYPCCFICFLFSNADQCYGWCSIHPPPSVTIVYDFPIFEACFDYIFVCDWTGGNAYSIFHEARLYLYLPQYSGCAKILMALPSVFALNIYLL